MDRFAKLVILAFALAAGSAHAVYTELTPPPGWNKGGSALWAAPSNSYAAQTANQWIKNAAKTSAMLNAGGRQIAVNASLKLGPTAPKVIAGIIFSNPALRAGVGIATWLGASKILWDEGLGQWVSQGSGGPVSDGNLYSYVPDFKPAFGSYWDACEAFMGIQNAASNVFVGFLVEGSMCILEGDPKKNGGNPFYHRTSLYEKADPACQNGGCEVPQPSKVLTQQEMVRLLNPENQIGWPMPETVPNELPLKTPLPVELPVVNPSTGVNPFPRPQFIPTGDPVKNPNYDASKPMTADNQPYLQPGVKVTPRPTTENPWQVDTQPVDRPQPTPDRLPDSELNPETDSGSDSNDKPKDEETISLCEKHPDILACQNLDQPDDSELPSVQKDISIHKDVGWGAENASCPPPKILNVQGRQIAIPFDLFCTYMQGMRPIIIAMAWLSAAFILLGARET